MIDSAIWRLYVALPAPARRAARRRVKWALPLTNLRVPVRLFDGSAGSGRRPVKLLLAGDERWVGFWKQRVFAGEPERRFMGKFGLWELPRRLARLRREADLTLVRLDRLSAAYGYGQEYRRAPEWIGTHFTAFDELPRLIQETPSLKSDMVKIKRNRLIPEVSHQEHDFRFFYERMYIPYIRRRFGSSAIVTNFHRQRDYFRKGGLMWIRRDQELIAGQLFEVRGGWLEIRAIGSAGGNLEPIRDGCAAALDCYCIRYAQERGLQGVDFGGCRPLLNDGLLRFKRKWGMELVQKETSYFDLLFYWECFSPAVLEFLEQNPLIMRSPGGFSGLTAVAGPHPGEERLQKLQSSLWMKGLDTVHVQVGDCDCPPPRLE